MVTGMFSVKVSKEVRSTRALLLVLLNLLIPVTILLDPPVNHRLESLARHLASLMLDI
jgi:hypothetical protein